MIDLFNLKITNPKRQSKALGLYNYYAGYSPDFAKNIILSAKLNNKQIVLDPWNGSGTTTSASSENGIKSLGTDLNPVMVIVAKANLINRNELTSIEPIAQNIVVKAKTLSASYAGPEPNDQLGIWFNAQSVQSIRRIEKAIQLLLVNDKRYESLAHNNLNELSTIASFYYVVLFRTVRRLLAPFLGSNPTWIKRPIVHQNKLRPSFQTLIDVFLAEVTKMMKQCKIEKPENVHHEISDIQVGSSMRLNLHDKKVDFILTSPPYCTRIDYAVSTLPELSILGYDNKEFRVLRTSMIGTTTIDPITPAIDIKWGKTCHEFVDKIAKHESKASPTYYFKNHLQYFDSISRSISEISRVLKHKGAAVFVVQNSYYKDVFNDLCKIYSEMAQINGLELIRREDFKVKRTMAGIKNSNRKYRGNYAIEESVLCFLK